MHLNKKMEIEFDHLPTYIHSQGNYVIVGGGGHMSQLASLFGYDEIVMQGIKFLTLAEWCAKNPVLLLKAEKYSRIVVFG